MANDIITISQLQNEKLITDILQLMLWKKDEDDKPYTIAKACAEVGINPSTWHRWVQEGMVDGAMKQIKAQIDQAAHEKLLPYHDEVMETLVNMARGIPPEGLRLKAGDVLAAIREYMRIVDLQPMGQEVGTQTELEHLESFQPKQLFVNVQAGDFIYQGGSSMRSVPKEKIVEVEEPSGEE